MLFQKRPVLNNLDIYALYALQIELKTDVLHTIKGNWIITILGHEVESVVIW